MSPGQAGPRTQNSTEKAFANADELTPVTFSLECSHLLYQLQEADGLSLTGFQSQANFIFASGTLSKHPKIFLLQSQAAFLMRLGRPSAASRQLKFSRQPSRSDASIAGVPPEPRVLNHQRGGAASLPVPSRTQGCEPTAQAPEIPRACRLVLSISLKYRLRPLPGGQVRNCGHHSGDPRDLLLHMRVSALRSFIDLSAPLETSYVSGKPHQMSGLPSDLNISALPSGGPTPHRFFRWRLWPTLAAEK
ncbi:hypothetical protein STEG23_000454 [Scotinomys teguina]